MASLVLGGILQAQTPVENNAAFAGSAAFTKTSYHWQSMSGTTPIAPPGTRSPLPYAPAPLTTISYDSSNPALYQQKVIGGTTYDCVLVGTFTPANGFWNQAGGTEVTLTYTSGTTTHYIFPYVTVGNDLHSYLTDTYFQSISPTDAEVAHRIDQSLGLDPSVDLTVRGLAFFWAPIDHIVRSGYLPDVSVQVADLQAFSDGSYIPEETGRDPSFQYADFGDNTIRYNSNLEFVSTNQAKTYYPWTAMGYTFNWNALQNGDYDPSYGYDDNAPDSFFGLTEFMVSAGSQVVLESWVPYSDLDVWIVPEPGSFGLAAFGVALVLIRRRSFR